MRLPGVRDDAVPVDDARALLREAVRLGVDLIDTAWIYGRSEELIADALHPYPEGLVIATKGGLRAGGHPDGRPERLCSDCEDSLRRLRVDTIDVWQLHRIDPDVGFEEQSGVIGELREEGKVRFVGVSEVSVEELRRARALIEIATCRTATTRPNGGPTRCSPRARPTGSASSRGPRCAMLGRQLEPRSPRSATR